VGDEAVDHRAIGKVAFQFRIQLALARIAPTTNFSNWIAGTRATRPASFSRR
jgi:hypothetical protein